MLKVDSELHIQDPSIQNKRYLHKGTVLEVTGDAIIAAYANSRFEIENEQEVAVFYNHNRKFLQQAAKVLDVLDDETQLVLKIETRGDPVSAEGREHYRVSTASADIKATIGDEGDCALVDISAMGFAVITHQNLNLGSSVTAAVTYVGEDYSGTVCVQSVRDLGRGRIRYGMRYLEDESQAGTLRTGLQKICIAVERELLKNQSGRS
jgi:hypothetical protein